MSVFDRAERLLSRTHVRVFAELVLITPMRSGMIVGPDVTRAPFEIMATLDVRSKAKRPLGEGNTAGDVAGIMAPDISLAIDMPLLAGRPAIRDGDRVTALKRPGQPSFVIAQEAPLGISERQWELLPASPDDAEDDEDDE